MDPKFFTARAQRFTGTWTLDPSRSRYEFGEVPKQTSMTLSLAEGGFDVRISAVGPQGTPLKTEGMFLFGETEKQSTELREDGALVQILKRDGKPLARVVRELSEDGQTLTVTQTYVAEGKTFVNVGVYVKTFAQS